jgi:hypothetical protein
VDSFEAPERNTEGSRHDEQAHRKAQGNTRTDIETKAKHEKSCSVNVAQEYVQKI